VAVVAFSSNSSLCGSFNANVIRRFNEVLSELSDKGYLTEDVDVYAAGRKVADAARKKGYEPVAELYDMVDKPDYAYASELSSDLVDKFISEEVSQVILIYSHFASMGSQPVLVENYLPFTLSKDPASEVPVDYILEPDPLSLVRSLLPKVLKLKIYTVMLDASAAEHAARTIAMQVASDNAQNLIAELTLVYNKTRQQAITAEILDIVGGSMNS
jgi:F-type H+-transporting ATPase subunit gamma